MKLFSTIIKLRWPILLIFLGGFIASLYLQTTVSVNYDISDYLPENAPSTIAIDVMETEFSENLANAKIMVKNVSLAEALLLKQDLLEIEGVLQVTWLDSAVDLNALIGSGAFGPGNLSSSSNPLNAAALGAAFDPAIIAEYYKDDTALFAVAIDENYRISAVDQIRDLIGADNAMTGSAVATALAMKNTISEVGAITLIAVIFIFLVLIFTTTSWLEPFIILVGLMLAVILNSGTNAIFGEISFVTSAACAILQLAVSLDYSVFLIHCFDSCRQTEKDPARAMAQALKTSAGTILASGLTTIIGFLALVLMQFRIGPDLGLALTKGVLISLLTVFLFLPALILLFHNWLDRTRHRRLIPPLNRFGRLVKTLAPVSAILTLILLIPTFVVAQQNSYLYGSSQIYGEDSVYGQDTTAIETVFGQTDTYVLLVPKGDLEAEVNLSAALRNLEYVTGLLSYVDTVGADVPESMVDKQILSLLRSEHYSRFVLTVDVPTEGDSTFELIKTVRATAGNYYPEFYLAGEGVSAYDLKTTVESDLVKVNLIVIFAILLVLIFTFRKLWLPIILVLIIELAIQLNLAIPFLSGSPVYYIAYLIISAIQLGATVDYAILLTTRYRVARISADPSTALVQTVTDSALSILTSGSVMCISGLLLGFLSSNRLIAQLGFFIGLGAVFSVIMVLFVLPGLLRFGDRFVIKKIKPKL